MAIITGGASGIGASTVHLFHEHGAKVVIADVQDNLGQEIADKLGKNVSYIHCDVTMKMISAILLTPPLPNMDNLI